MRKLRSFLLSLLALPLLSSFLFAALTAPRFDAVKNFGGPLVLFWNTGANDVASTEYWIFRSTTPLNGLDFAGLRGRLQNDTDAKTVAYPGMNEDVNYVWEDNIESGKTYYFRLVAYDYEGDADAPSPLHRSATADVKKTIVTSITRSVDEVNGKYTMNFDTQSIRFDLEITLEDGSPCLPPDNCKVDIKTNSNPASVFVSPRSIPRSAMTVLISSETGQSFCRASFTWDGSVYSDAGNKHYGLYSFEAVPVVKGAEIADGNRSVPCAVDVVHINKGQGIVYGTSGSGVQAYGPPVTYNFYLSKDSYVTWKIWDTHNTENPSDDTVLRVIMSSGTMASGDRLPNNDPLLNSPGNWNLNTQTLVWDGRDETGSIVPNGIYRYTAHATANRFSDPALTDSAHAYHIDYRGDLVYQNWVEGTIAIDAIRLVDFQASGITDKSPLAQFEYTLGGINAMTGGATVKIIICSAGTTFNAATSSGTLTYQLNGRNFNYEYVPGDPLPSDASRLQKVFSFIRYAGGGARTETWNGQNEAGTPLPNSSYRFALSAVDDSGNSAFSVSGDEHFTVGDITIDRTAAQEVNDTVPPTIDVVSVGGTAVPAGSAPVLSAPFNTIVVQMHDPGGSGVNLNNTFVSLIGPATNFITLATTNNGSDTLTLGFPNQTTNGTYTLHLIPRDMAGNVSSTELVYTFTLNNLAPGASPSSFTDSIYVFPNPAKGANLVTFAYDAPAVTTLKLEVYSILGELLYEEEWLTAAGNQTKTWNIVNKAQSRLASGMYLYRITDKNAASKPKKLKKLIVIQ